MWYEKIYMVDYKLQRFLDAQQGVYNQALAEVKNGKKYSHWIWYIFPQLKGLGMSYNSQYYGICGKEEAEAYLAHPILGVRLREITTVFLQLKGKTAVDVFGGLDAMKVLSCMTLFNEVASDDLFQKVIDLYFQGRLDETTKKILNIDDAYNCRYTFRYANIEVGRTCFVAFWKRSKEWWAFKRMPLYTDECFMDIFGWYLDLFVTSGFWSCPMYHHHWDTLWFAAL